MSLTPALGHRKRPLSALIPLLGLACNALAGSPAPADPINVLTWHNDNGRTGQNLNETLLNPSNVNARQFGKKWTLPVDGYVNAQPLYVSPRPAARRGQQGGQEGQPAQPPAGRHRARQRLRV